MTTTQKYSFTVVPAAFILLAVLTALPAHAQEPPSDNEHPPSFEGDHSSKWGEPVHRAGRQKSGNRFGELSKRLGITVDELKKMRENPELREEFKERMRTEHEERIEQLAQRTGVTVDELRAAKEDPELRAQIKERMKAFFEERLEKIAEKKGVSVEELREKIQEKRKRIRVAPRGGNGDNWNNGRFNPHSEKPGGKQQGNKFPGPPQRHPAE